MDDQPSIKQIEDALISVRADLTLISEFRILFNRRHTWSGVEELATLFAVWRFFDERGLPRWLET